MSRSSLQSKFQPPTALQQFYTFIDNSSVVFDRTLFHGLALSPKSFLFQPHKHTKGVTCCPHCKQQLLSKKLPQFAIINKHFVGGAPLCLTELTEVELAFLTPISTHGFCFHYTGG